jgi:hypothetical protein
MNTALSLPQIKRRMVRLLKPVFIVTLILTIGTLLVNRTLFLHVHILPDGRIVAHAHPLDNGNGPERGRTHSHSSAELLILQYQDHLYNLEASSAVLITPAVVVEKIECASPPAGISATWTRPGRAPPVS